MLRIRKEDYQKFADDMLEYYGIQRNENGVLDVVELVKKMDAKIDIGCPSRSHSVFGMLVLENTTVRLFNPETYKFEDRKEEANTIVIDEEAATGDSLSSFHVTLCHECFHLHYHKMAFKLMKFFSKQKYMLKTI